MNFLIQEYDTPQASVEGALGNCIHYITSKGVGPVVCDIDDTLVMDREEPLISKAVVALCNELRHRHCKIHLVTARSPSLTHDTEVLLRSTGLNGYDSLYFAPDSRRTSLLAAASWKFEIRSKIARESGGPILLSIGDQWGDLLRLSGESHIDTLDDLGNPVLPFKLVRVNDECVIWGLKLKAY